MHKNLIAFVLTTLAACGPAPSPEFVKCAFGPEAPTTSRSTARH